MNEISYDRYLEVRRALLHAGEDAAAVDMTLIEAQDWIEEGFKKANDLPPDTEVGS